MKTYETWEVIKALSENPKLKFKTDSQGYGYGHEVCLWIDKGGDLVADEVIKQDHPTTCERWLKATWQLVSTPVTWQEAIQAWSEGKTVRCEREGKLTCEYSQGRNKLTDQYGWGPEKDEFLTGTWFIEDSADE